MTASFPVSLPMHGFSTGTIRVKTRFLHPLARSVLTRSVPGRLLTSLLDPHFTLPLPVWCWVIEHPAGPVVVDTGLISGPPEDNLFARTQTRADIAPGQQLSQQMRAAGLDPHVARFVLFTHLHLDHDRGAGDFPGARLLASGAELRRYTGRAARLLGYSRPTWARPAEPVRFRHGPFGPFPAHHDLYGDGRILLLPTPGHTAGHLSVLVRQPGADVLLAGDLTYSEAALVSGEVGGLPTRPGAARRSAELVRAYAREHPLIYLPSHDPDALERLARERVCHFQT